MRHHIFTLVFFGITQISFAQTGNSPVISAVKAYLFYNQDKYDEKAEGSFSENIIENPKFPLWNTMIGEGAAKAYSNNTFIVAEIAIPKPCEYYGACVRLVVTEEGGKVLYSRKQCISLSLKGISYSVPFLINETGCNKWKLKVELYDLSEKKLLSKMVKEIEFACGE